MNDSHQNPQDISQYHLLNFNYENPLLVVSSHYLTHYFQNQPIFHHHITFDNLLLSLVVMLAHLRVISNLLVMAHDIMLHMVIVILMVVSYHFVVLPSHLEIYIIII